MTEFDINHLNLLKTQNKKRGSEVDTKASTNCQTSS